MIFKDYYKILGLENNKVSSEDIRYAYRELAKKYHPDINTENSFSEERFKEVNEAYRILSDSSARRKYDRTWNMRIGSKKRKEQTKREEGSFFSNFINMFFGNIGNKKEKEIKHNKKIPKKGENISTEIDVSIEEAFYGVDKKISLRAVNGKVKTFSIKIPMGIHNGEKIRLIGQGRKGENGAKNGDLLIRVNILNSKQFSLKGTDIYTDLELTPWEAALGTKLNVQAIDESISLHIPKGVQSGEKVRIPEKGYKDGKGGRGDLVIRIKIMVPKNISEEEEKLFEELKKISKFIPKSRTA